MKSITQFQAVIDAIAAVSKQKTVTGGNGTTGMEILCHVWNSEAAFDAERATLETAIAKAVLRGNVDEVVKLKEDLGKLPAPKTVLVLKLMNPINKLIGTKVIPVGGKTYTPEMEKVEYLYVQQDALDMKLMEYEETADRALDVNGNEQIVIRLVINDGIIDIKEGKRDRLGKVVRMPRAYIYPISARAMQIAGRMMGSDKFALDALFGVTENA